MKALICSIVSIALLLMPAIGKAQKAAESTDRINGLWHVRLEAKNDASLDVDGFSAFMKNMNNLSLNTQKWFISTQDNRISITEYNESPDTMDPLKKNVYSEELPIKDYKYENGRLQIITKAVSDTNLGVIYTTTKYDITFQGKEDASGQWKEVVNSGANDPNPIRCSGTIALHRLSSQRPNNNQDDDDMTIK